MGTDFKVDSVYSYPTSRRIEPNFRDPRTVAQDPVRMRAALFVCIASFLRLVRSDNISPFHTALSHDFEVLAKRQDDCPDGFNSCGMLGSWDACCQPDTICSKDAADNIGCCPSGSECTGTVPTPTDDGDQDPSSTGFRFPTQVTPTTTTPPGDASTVPDAPFPFTFIPTTFSDQEECATSYTGCQEQYSSCRASLDGVHGVTIGGSPDYGVTREGVEPTGDGQAICTSLLNRACHGLQVAYCTAYADGKSPGNGGGDNPGAASTTRSSALYEILTGLAIALAGMVA